MGFLAPWFLVGLAGAAVPVIFHLMRRRNAKTVIWGAYLFLHASLTQRRRRMMLEELLLLACRVLAGVFVALALARPFLPQVRFDRLGRGGRDIALVFDISASMDLRGVDGRTNLERAIAEARNLVRDAPRGTSFGIVLAGAMPRTLTPAPTGSRREIYALLDGIGTAQLGTMDAPRALSAAAMVLAAGSDATKQIVVFGDGQAEGWDAEDAARWSVVSDVFAQLPTAPSVIWRTLEAPSSIRDVGVRSIVPSRDVIGLDREVTFRIAIANPGSEAVTPKAVSLLVDGAPVASAPVGTVAPGISKTVELRHRFSTAGVRTVVAQVEASDDLASDDSAAVVIHVLRELPVLLVDGRAAESPRDRATGYLATALRPAGSPDKMESARALSEEAVGAGSRLARDFLVRPMRTSVAQLTDGKLLANAAMVVLADVPSLPEAAADAVSEFAARGGGVLIALGAQSDPKFWNEWTRGAQSVLPAQLGEYTVMPDEDAAHPFALDSFTGEVFAHLPAAGADLARAPFAAWWNATPREQASVEARLANGAPALVSQSFGRGRVVMSSVALDASASMLPARMAYVPFVHELAYWLVAPTLTHLNLTPGEGATLLLSAGGRAAPVLRQGLEMRLFRNDRWLGDGEDAPELAKQIAFNWGNTAPKSTKPNFPADKFTIRWTGYVSAPETGDWEFRFEADDYAELWLDNEPYRRARRFVANQPCRLRVDYREDFGDARITLFWRRLNASGASAAWTPVPASAFHSDGTASAEDDMLALGNAGPRAMLHGTAPDGDEFDVPLLDTARGPAVRISRPLVPGIWQLTLPQELRDDVVLSALASTNGVIPFCVQDRAAEGDLSPLVEEMRDRVRASGVKLVVAAQNDELKDALSGRAFGTELWRPLALLALVFVVLEVWLCRWISCARKTLQSTDVAFETGGVASEGGDDAAEAEPKAVASASLARVGALALGFFVGAWMLLRLIAQVFTLLTPWPEPLLSALASLALTCIWCFYTHERRLLGGRRGAALAGVRLAIAALLLWMLAQPVLSFDRTRRVHRRVAVLVDASASMDRVETQWTPQERVDMAQALSAVRAEERPFARTADELAVAAAELRVARELAQREDAKLLDDASLRRRVESLRKVASALPAKPAIPQAVAVVEAARAVEKGKKLSARTAAERVAALDSLLLATDRLIAALPERVQTETKALEERVPNELVERERRALASDVLRGTNGVTGLLSALADHYDVELWKYARDAARVADVNAFWDGTETNAAFSAQTDFTKSLETLLSEIDPQELAGVLLVSDGRDNGAASPEAVARHFGQNRSPISTLLVGGTKSQRDLAVLDVRSPESLFLGDRVRIAATVLALDAAGTRAKVRFKRGDEVLDERDVDIATDKFTTELRFSDTPAEKGLHRYTVEIAAEGESDEKELANNRWDFSVPVSDDRTAVLLVDRRPRWEFRYLRNLFFGRDKSVHLQYWLTEPDVVAGQPHDLPPASAAREFGDAEAGGLPESFDEWRRFDVIILGDVGEDVLTPEVAENLRRCVEERGATLLAIAGPQAMPYGLRDRTLLDLLPVIATNAPANPRRGPEDGFHVALTPAGRAHPFLALSDSATENEQLWARQPLWHWRMPIDDVKPGAEVLAYAEPDETTLAGAMPAANVRHLGETEGEAALRRLGEIRRKQTAGALVVVKEQGRGRVGMLLTDESWRLRYRTGDTWHHRFWGQMLRWGTGEKLRAGNDCVRLGSDRLSYAPHEPVHLRARLVRPDFSALEADEHPEAVVMCNGDERARIPLVRADEGHGLWEGVFDGADAEGDWTVRLDAPRARKELADQWPEELALTFAVDSVPRPVETVYTTADASVATRIATLSGGRCVSPAAAATLADAFGAPSGEVKEHLERSLWSTWPIFLLLVGLLVTEWTLRKRAGLA